jgi:hypothetical protein
MSLEQHNVNIQRILASRDESNTRWRKSFLSSLSDIKKEAEREKNAIRVRADTMPLRTFEFRESRRREMIGDICDALVTANSGWENKKIHVAVGKTMSSLGCKIR